MPKITVNKLNLIESKKLTSLVGMSLSHIYSVLQKTPYNLELSNINSIEFNSFSLEEALLRNYIKILEELRDLSPKDIRLMLSCMLMKFEVNCIKTLLRVKEAKLSVDEGMKYVFPTGKLTETRCRKILENSENITDVIDSLLDLEYGFVLVNAYEIYLETKIFHLLEVALDKYVYARIFEAINKFRGLDKKIAKTIFGLEIDLENIKTIFRFKELGINNDLVKHYIIPHSEVLNPEDFDEVLMCSDRQSMIKLLIKVAKRSRAKDHLYLFRELQDSQFTSLSILKKMFDKGLIKTNLRMIKRYTQFFNIGLLLAFINLKWFEIQDLRTIIRGSEAKIDPDRVRKLLVH